MPNARDISNSLDAAFLLVGDSGTHKTYFIGTCPKPCFVFDFDKGMSILAGQDVDYETFKELPYGEKARPNSPGIYEYGKAWGAFMKKLNEIGQSMDAGTCPYKTLAFDSLTFLSDICQSHILTLAGRPGKVFGQGDKDSIKDWAAFLNFMSVVVGQLVSWPGIKVMTAHIRRMENDLTKLEEKLPFISGQFSAKVSTFFDEVYFANANTVKGKTPAEDKVAFSIQTMPDNVVRQAKSRRWNVPNGIPLDFNEVLKHTGLKP